MQMMSIVIVIINKINNNDKLWIKIWKKKINDGKRQKEQICV